MRNINQIKLIMYEKFNLKSVSKWIQTWIILYCTLLTSLIRSPQKDNILVLIEYGAGNVQDKFVTRIFFFFLSLFFPPFFLTWGQTRFVHAIREDSFTLAIIILSPGWGPFYPPMHIKLC